MKKIVAIVVLTLTLFAYGCATMDSTDSDDSGRARPTSGHSHGH